LSVLGRPTFFGVNHRQGQRRVPLLLSDRRQNPNPPVLDLEDSVSRIAIVVSDLDVVKTSSLNLIHLIRNRVITATGQTIDTGSHQEARPKLMGFAKRLEDVPYAIADMNAPPRLSEQFGRLLHVLQPPDAFLLLDRYPSRIDLLLERGGSLEFLPGP